MVQGFDGDVREVTDLPEENPVEHFWEKPENILHLIDLIFFCQEERDDIYS